MVKTSILKYTRFYVEIIEVIFYLVKDCDTDSWFPYRELNLPLYNLHIRKGQKN